MNWTIIRRRLNPLCWFWLLSGWLDFCSDSEGMACPNCGYDFDYYEGAWFTCSNSGTGYTPGEPTVHWFEGVQTCPRCTYQWDVSDSS